MQTKVFDMAGKQVGEIELSDAIFGIEPNESVVHDVVKNHLANCRQGTQSALTRAEVSGGGIKPWRQKGTGRARQGSIRAPQWYHGAPVEPLRIQRRVRRMQGGPRFQLAHQRDLILGGDGLRGILRSMIIAWICFRRLRRGLFRRKLRLFCLGGRIGLLRRAPRFCAAAQQKQRQEHRKQSSLLPHSVSPFSRFAKVRRVLPRHARRGPQTRQSQKRASPERCPF